MLKVEMSSCLTTAEVLRDHADQAKDQLYTWARFWTTFWATAVTGHAPGGVSCVYLSHG
jgi:hypothetical protein